MNAKKALRKWLAHIERSPAGTYFEVGLTWDQVNGWRVFQRMGDKGLAMAPAEARKLGDIYHKVGKRPEWRGVTDTMIETLGALRPLADEAEQKNRDKVVPEGAAEFMPVEGRA